MEDSAIDAIDGETGNKALRFKGIAQTTRAIGEKQIFFPQTISESDDTTTSSPLVSSATKKGVPCKS